MTHSAADGDPGRFRNDAGSIPRYSRSPQRPRAVPPRKQAARRSRQTDVLEVLDMKHGFASFIAVLALGVAAPLAIAQAEDSDDPSRSDAREDAREGKQDAR